jgi:competence protein ComGC
MEVVMKKALVIFILLLTTVLLLAQEKSTIAVKDSGTYTGVVVVTATSGGKSIELQCNQSSTSCAPLKAGSYVMVILPKNHGMYDCQNVDIYEGDADPATSQKIGEYCLTQK